MDPNILVGAYCDHATQVRGLSKVTVTSYRKCIDYYLRASGATRIGAASGESVRAFLLNGRINRGWKPGSFVTVRNNLAGFFRWCVERGHLPANPIEGIELPKLERRLPRGLRKQDAMKLLEVSANYPYRHPFLSRRNHAILATLVYAGLRKSEALGLRLSDVDLENLTIFVNRGKGNKDRFVPICYQLAESLRRYLAERQRLGKTCPAFFASFKRNVGFTETGLTTLVDEMREASGIKFSAHALRHTFATLMLEGGCDMYSLSRMMGHSDIKTTTIYLSASAEHLRAQIHKHPLNSA